MNWINRLNRRWRFGIDNLMIYIIVTMLVVYLLQVGLRIPVMGWIGFDRNLILSGQIWRIVTFVFAPPGSSNALFFLISLCFYYFIGNSLENTWGASRFTLYYLFGIIGAIIAGLLTGSATNHYLNLSLFFAFAHLFPNHQVMLFFLLPVKMKWLGYLNWIYFLISFLNGLSDGVTASLRFGFSLRHWVQCVAIIFSLINFFLFFGPEIFHNTRDRINSWKRRRRFNKDMKNGQDYWRR